MLKEQIIYRDPEIASYDSVLFWRKTRKKMKIKRIIKNIVKKLIFFILIMIVSISIVAIPMVTSYFIFNGG